MRKLVLCFFLMVFLGTISAPALDRQNSADYHARRVALSKKANGGIVVLFAANEESEESSSSGFRQNSYFYYLTGWNEPGAALLIAPEQAATETHPARAYEEIFFLPAHNVSQERWTGPKLGAESPEAGRITGFDKVEVLDKLRDELVRVLPSPRGTVFSDMGEADTPSPATIPLQWLRRANAFPNYAALRDVKPLLDEMRMIKDPGEMELIRKAADASMASHWAAMKTMKPGMSEMQVSWLMQYTFGSRGCERPAYAPIVGAGLNSTVLHYADNSGMIHDGDVVVMDVAGEYSLYASDITRTLPANGHFTTRQREIYDIVLGAQQAAIDSYREGKSVLSPRAENSLYKVAYDYINTHGKDLHGKPLGQYFIHGLSHYIGLDVHDTGSTNAPLAPGMVFSIEPGIYIPEEKIGIRIEDMFWIDPQGKLVMLTKDLPRTADEVEKAMAK